MEFTHRGSVTPKGAARKGRATWRKWFGKSLFYLAAVLQKPPQLREDTWSKPVGDPCVRAVFQEEAWLQHLENLCGTHWTAYFRLSWISQCFQAPGTWCVSQGYSTCGTCVSHAVAMRKLFGPRHLTTAEVATAAVLSLKHLTLSCGLPLGFSWWPGLYKPKAGISLRIGMFNDVMTEVMLLVNGSIQKLSPAYQFRKGFI